MYRESEQIKNNVRDSVADGVTVQRIFETLPAARPSPDELFLCINSRVTIRRGEFHGNSNGQCSMKNAEPARDIVRRNNSIRDLAWDRLTRDVGRERGDRMRKIKKKDGESKGDR